MRRLSVLVGAGASFDAGPDVSPNTPPLGSDLYAQLKAAYPHSWGHLSDKLKDLFLADFEEGMYELWLGESQPANAPPLLIEIARFFSRFEVTGPQNTYERLISRIEALALKRGITFASLNYECLLEQALVRHGLKVVHCAPAGRLDDEVLVLKPHGSCNFVSTINESHNTFIGTPNIYTGPVSVINPSQVEAHFDQGHSIPPAMSLYAPGKPTPVAPPLIASARQAWDGACGGSTLIVTIGARPFLADDHIFGPICRSSARVLMIGGQSAPDYPAFADQLGARLVYVGGRFAEDLDQLVGHLAP